MRLIAAAAALAAFVIADGALAAERPRCGVPDYLLFGESPLKRVSGVVATQKRLPHSSTRAASRTAPSRSSTFIST